MAWMEHNSHKVNTATATKIRGEANLEADKGDEGTDTHIARVFNDKDSRTSSTLW